MNHYPSWWNSTITLYNKYTDSDSKEVKWFRHIIDDCFYKHETEKMTIGNTTIESDVSICRIRVNDNFTDKLSWNELSDEDKETKLTLCVGDIIVAGRTDFEINEYEKGKRSSDLKNQYKEWPGCFTIESVGINTGGGRGNEHYCVKGL